MTEVEKQLHKMIAHAEKQGWNDGVEFVRIFLAKEKAINAKQHKHTQLQKDVRSNGSLPKVRTKKTRNVETEAGHEGT